MSPKETIHYASFVPGRTTGGPIDMRTTYVPSEVTCEVCRQMLSRGEVEMLPMVMR